MSSQIGNRLLTVAKFVRQGAYFADIGTDHAYLPLFLLKKGIIERAVLADINEGPLSTAKRNASAEGLLDKVEFRLTNGAEGLGELGITDYAICGMGGELIADIISRAPFFKNPSIRLVLQPMSKIFDLRKYLAKNGFEIIEEDYVSEGNRRYIILVAEYSGRCRELTYAEAQLGEGVPRVVKNETHYKILRYKRHCVCTAMLGKKFGGEDYSQEAELLPIIDEILSENKKFSGEENV